MVVPELLLTRFRFMKGFFIVVLIVVATGCSNTVTNSSPFSKEAADKNMQQQEPGYIAVHGDVIHPLNLTVDSLKNMQVKTIENYKIVNHTGEVKRVIPTCKGILLRDILERSHINQKDAKDRNFYITVKASDGYMATFSWAELFNHATGDSTYLIFEEDGKLIAERGPFVLITTGDKITGVRHVYLVNEIEVHRVN